MLKPRPIKPTKKTKQRITKMDFVLSKKPPHGISGDSIIQEFSGYNGAFA
jgi:hypothetical protein